MARKILRVIPFESCEVSSIESWLNDMAATGLYLTDAGGRFASFERRESEYIRYAAEYLEVYGTKPGDEQLELYASTGWSFVTHMAGDLFIYSTSDPAAPPLHNDYSGLEKPMRQMKQKQAVLAWVFIMMVLFTSVGPAVVGVLTGKGLDYWWLIEFGTGRTIVTIIMSLLMLAIAIIHFRRASLAKRIIIKGELPPTKRDYRRRAVAAGLLLPLSIICVVLWFGLKLDRPGVHRYTRMTQEETFAFPLIDEVFEQDGALLAAAKEAAYDPAFDNDRCIEQDLLAPEHIGVSQSVYEIERTENDWKREKTIFSYRVDYYDTVSEKVAERLIEGRREMMLEGGYYTEMEIDVPGAERAFIYSLASDGGEKCFDLRVGTRVASVYYTGEYDIRDAIPIFVEYLKTE